MIPSVTETSPVKQSMKEEIPWAWIKCIKDLTECKSSSMTKVVSLPAEILSWLFLSDEAAVRDVSKLKEMGVTHVLSLNGMPARQAEWMSDMFRANGITHRTVKAEDREGYDLLDRHWDECREFLADVRDGGGKVVVHCVAGINRSGLIACAAHMVLERAAVLDVVRHCVAQRGMVLWNRSFQRQLCILAAEEGLLGEKPPGYTDEPIIEKPPPPPASAALDRLCP